MSKFLDIVKNKRPNKMSKEEKLVDAFNKACVWAVHKNLNTPRDYLNDKDGIIFATAIYELRTEDTIKATKVLGLARKIKNGTLDAEERFKLEDELNSIVEEIISEKEKALSEIQADKRGN